MQRYTSENLTVSGLNFHHLEWQGDDPPVVFLPGFISNAYAALRLGNLVSPQRRVLAFDLRGRGGSDKPAGTYGFEQHLDDIQARLDALGLDQIILVGHSFGALLSLIFAAFNPDRIGKVIIFDGGAAPTTGAQTLFRDYHENLTYSYPSAEAYLAPYRTMMTMQPWTEEAEALVRANISEQPDGSVVRTVPRHVVEAELKGLSNESRGTLNDLYPLVKVPVLLIRAGMGSFGKEDQHISDEVLKSMTLPDLRVHDMPNAGHTSVLTIPDENRDEALLKFVRE